MILQMHMYLPFIHTYYFQSCYYEIEHDRNVTNVKAFLYLKYVFLSQKWICKHLLSIYYLDLMWEIINLGGFEPLGGNLFSWVGC